MLYVVVVVWGGGGGRWLHHLRHFFKTFNTTPDLDYFRDLRDSISIALFSNADWSQWVEGDGEQREETGGGGGGERDIDTDIFN